MNKKFIIYGAGNRGKWCLDFLKWRKIDDKINAFCDVKYKEINKIDDKYVLSYQDAKKLDLPFLISNSDEDIVLNIKNMLQDDGCEYYFFDEFYKILNEEQTVFLREWCAYHHAKNNNQWFDDAEKNEVVDVFWNKKSIFYKLFTKLDLHTVIELACGRGRHVPHYLDKADEITLVDILEENILFCKRRFKDVNNLKYYKNNGFNLEKLPCQSYTSLFTYDSMVHFELMDINRYLKDIYRVLVNGGRALFHHSNYSSDYKTDFAHAPHARCFMNKDIFAYLACRAGFKILEQEVIDWYGEKELDCVTLVEK